MTKPTQAQIEAVLAEFEDELTSAQRKLITAELCRITAAAEVGDEFKPIYDSPNNRVRAAVAAEREACAKVVDGFAGDAWTHSLEEAAAAIRARMRHDPTNTGAN